MVIIIGGGAMNDKRVRSFVLVITFLCSLVAGSHEANRKFAQGFVTTGVDWNIHDIDEDMAEKMWLHCRKEVLEITEDYEYSDLYVPPAASDGENVAEADIGLIKKRILHKAITDLPPHAKHNLLSCLDRKLSQSQSYEETSALINWNKLFFDWSSIPRRYLQRRLGKHHKHKARQGKPATAASRRAGVVHPPQPPSPAPATPDNGTTTLNVKTDKSPAPSPGADAPQGQNNGTSSGSKGSLFGASAIGQTQNKKTPLDALEQLQKKQDQSPAPQTSPVKKSNAPSPSPTEKSNSSAPSPSKQNTPAPSPPEKKKAPAPSPPEKSKAPAPPPPEKSKEPATPPPAKTTEPPPSPPHISKPPETSPAKKHKSPESSADDAQPEVHDASSSKPKDKSETSSNKAGVIAGCSVAGAVIIAIFLCCCLRKKNKDDDLDDKPFSLYSNDLSAGTLQTSNGKGNSSNAGFNSSSNETTLPVVSGAEAQSSGAAGDENLPPPPGKPGPPPPEAPPPPAAPPPPPPKPAGPKAPPPPAAPKAPPPKPGKPPPLMPNNKSRGSKDAAEGSEDQKAKLKPFFWDKVLANPDHSMVWNEIKSGSFQFNEEMMESLFGYKAAEQNKNERKKDPSAFEAPKYIQIIDPRKAQNLSILLRALNVTTEEVCDAILEGNELPGELIQTLLKMAPTTEEELKLRLYDGELSQLGPAERFLKTMVDIPFAFKRLESLLFMCTVQEEVSSVKESLACIKVACNELKNSRVFLKLLEAVLKTGNRMNDGTFRGGAQAFKLDTLLKLSDVKGIDGKTTLLHFVVLEIIRSEGIRAARKERENQSPTSVKTDYVLEDSSKETADYVRNLGLEVVSNLSKDLENVKKAAVVDGDMVTSTVLRLGHSLKKSKEFLNNEMDGLDGESEFRETLSSFVQQAEEDIIWLLEEEKKMTSLVKSTADYFHGTQGKDEGLRLFSIVRDFLVIVDKVCNEVKKSTTNPIKIPKKMTSSASTASQESHQPTSPNLQQRLFPAIKEQRPNGSSFSDSGSSDDEK